jgi:ATP-dependent exoDNAse (exonuclease V) alpha subunit
VVTVVEAATGEEYILTRSAEIASLHHAYAATCHKFQGSQARNVMVICHRNMPFGLNREWLYTACSRAKERVFLLHEKPALSKSIEKQLILGRNPKEKAEYLVKLYANRQFAIPRLPDARRLKG